VKIPTVACVLRSGGDYCSEHVVALYRGVRKYWDLSRLGYLRFICLTDVPFLQFGVENIPLIGDWPGWWSKMELFRPDITGDLLYIDLDTVIVGPLADIVEARCLTVLRDFYDRGKPERQRLVGSGLMYLPEDMRVPIWRRWLLDPQGHMTRFKAGGDQAFLQAFVEKEAARWQDLLPGQVVSYKVHIKPTGKAPAGSRVVCFHGLPRPWKVPPFWERNEEAATDG